jgi:hypothetical protein
MNINRRKGPIRMRYVFALLWLVPSAAWSQSPSTPVATNLTLHPRAAASPALKHRLMPAALDLQPGNAAVFYQRAHSPEWTRSLHQSSWLPKLDQWLNKPQRDIPARDVEGMLAFKGIFKELHVAARCENCDWQLSQRLRDEGFMLLLPDVQGFRVFGQMLAVKARKELHDGKFEQALETLQTGLAMSRHLSDSPILLNALVGLSIGNMMVSTLEDFVQQPEAPNLYWALRDLPAPLIDLRRPLQGNQLAMEALFPEVRRAMSGPKLQAVPLATLRQRVDQTPGLGADARVQFATFAGLVHPKAVAFFKERGHDETELDALPVTQLALMYAMAQAAEWNDALVRLHSIPYWQARPGIKKAVEERTEALRDQRALFILGDAFMPANESIFFLRARLERRLAGLQVVEALRLYAAAHGRLPQTLDEVRDAPIPIDPVTGRKFDYSASDGVARLHGPPPPGEVETERNILLYQINLAAAKSGVP